MMSSQMKTVAKKRFGQHFLRDTGTIERIVRLIQPSVNDLILEIGAGDGALSVKLAPLISRLVALELDYDCLPALETSLRQYPSAEIVEGDILQLDLPELFSSRDSKHRLRIAGNLPYNISTAIIQKLLTLQPPVWDMNFLVQFEVAERIAAAPGSPAYGFLSVYCQHLSDVRMGFKVSPACFVPRPKVTSAMITLFPHSGVQQPDPHLERSFVEVAKAAFSHRRKTLANSLRRHGVIGRASDAILSVTGIDGKRRAEDLSVQEYELLAKAYLELPT
jgi:16S rRNA (adenine1518-N6/adenine1519-N6)-dimethyltransferase